MEKRKISSLLRITACRDIIDEAKALKVGDSMVSDHWITVEMKTVKRVDLQGGIVSCAAQRYLVTAAVEDLGLPYLYDRSTAREGVWYIMGAESTNPTKPWHESFVYKSADEETYYLDVHTTVKV